MVGGELLCAGSDNAVAVWDPAAWAQAGSLAGHTSWVNDVAADPARPGRAYTASDDGTVRVWDVPARRCVAVLDALGGPAHAVAAAGGEVLVGAEGKVLVFDAATLALKHRLSNHTHVLRSMSDGRQVRARL